MKVPLIIGIAIIVIFIIVALLLLFQTKKRNLTYVQEIHTTFPPDQLWENLEKAINNSRDSHMWPNELELLYSEKGVQEGAEITATYKTTSTPKTYNYIITDYNEGHSFSYKAAEDHPYEGGGTVEVTSNDHTTLRWSISYHQNSFSLNALYMRYIFYRKFFKALQQRVKDLEPPKDLV